MLAYLSRYINNFSSHWEPLRRLTRHNAKFKWTNEQQTAFDDFKKAITSAPVLIPYNPERDKFVICDGSLTGLGGALFQKTLHGYQLVHYVSRTVTDTESRYSHIERETSAAEFTTSHLQMCLLGVKHFQLATDDKSLLPLFNNPQAKLLPRIERLIMKMQNLDFTMIDFSGVDKHVRAVTIATESEQETIATETEQDAVLQLIKPAMQTGVWDKKDPILKPYIDVQPELYESENVILRLNKIVPPENLRVKIVRIAHKQRHIGLSKTKEMIKHKYWWPGMNLQIEDAVKRCFECQISTATKHTEPAKMTKFPSRLWTTVEFTTTTSFEATRKKLNWKKIFATHGVPQNLQSDNGPPFNSHAFSYFARESGFRHKRITPRHPKAQGQVEGFNKLVNKIMTIARHDRNNPDKAIYDRLQAYRSTPHPATKVPPYQLLMNRESKCKKYHDKRHKTKTHKLKPGDAALVKRENKRKGLTLHEPYVYVVTEIKGSQMNAKRIKDERKICRDTSKFKHLPTTKPNEQITLRNENIPNISIPDTTEIEQPTATPTNIAEPNDSTEKQQQPEPESQPEQQPRRSERLKNKLIAKDI
ncbi:Transposon Tf2-9 poly [Paramuricea clavata]|uniref:Transposon Tf2-9 poly n=1 Tax=Paramuricea clavata TaxID=317549 RepID=A0A7D9M4N5_PARCT|nr:Transposon Tf2-9 poly [Paramuricea clavata]